MHSSVMRLPTCSVRGPTTHHPIVLCTARHGLGLPFRVRSRSALGPGLRMALPRNPHASLHAQLRRAFANLFLCAGPTHTSLLSVTRPVRERLRSFRARLRRTVAGLFRVWPRRALPSCPLHGTRFSARPMHDLATHVPDAAMHGPAVSLPSSSVYGPAVHFAPGL